jgi:hypothetical protein
VSGLALIRSCCRGLGRTEEMSYDGNDEGGDGRGEHKASAIHGMLMVEPVKEIMECACPATCHKTNNLCHLN